MADVNIVFRKRNGFVHNRGRTGFNDNLMQDNAGNQTLDPDFFEQVTIDSALLEGRQPYDPEGNLLVLGYQVKWDGTTIALATQAEIDAALDSVRADRDEMDEKEAEENFKNRNRVPKSQRMMIRAIFETLDPLVDQGNDKTRETLSFLEDLKQALITSTDHADMVAKVTALTVPASDLPRNLRIGPMMRDWRQNIRRGAD